MSANLAESPAQVPIWFDGPVEKMFLEVRVETVDQRRVDKQDVARDGHKREGSFSFLVE
jgi:methionine-rich copper-binding protein CopC